LKGKLIINDFRGKVEAISPTATQSVQFLAAEAQMKMFDIHARAIAALCECLGMNAENMLSAMQAGRAQFDDSEYQKVMSKWELIDEKGEPLI